MAYSLTDPPTHPLSLARSLFSVCSVSAVALCSSSSRGHDAAGSPTGWQLPAGGGTEGDLIGELAEVFGPRLRWSRSSGDDEYENGDSARGNSGR